MDSSKSYLGMGGEIACDPDGHPIHSEYYNSGTIVVPANQTNWSVRNEAAGDPLFRTVTGWAHRLYIKTDEDIEVRFNHTSNDLVPIETNKMFDDDALMVRDIYITTVSAANVYIYMRGSKI